MPAKKKEEAISTPSAPLEQEEAISTPSSPPDLGEDAQLLEAVAVLLKDNPDIVLGSLQNMSEINQRKALTALGGSPIARQKKQKNLTNENIRNIALAGGSILHEDSSWRPKPSAKVASKGPEAVAEFNRRWDEGSNTTLSSSELNNFGRNDVAKMIADEGLVT